MPKKKAKYDFSKWDRDRDLVSSISGVKNKALLNALISKGIAIEEVRMHLTGPLRPETKSFRYGELSQKLKEINDRYSYGIRFLKGFLKKADRLIRDDERDVLESVLCRFENRYSLMNDQKTLYENVLKTLGINPRLKTANQQLGMLVHILLAVFIKPAKEMGFTQQDVFSLIAELLNITNPQIQPKVTYSIGKVRYLERNFYEIQSQLRKS
ncbi:MAG: hypothetical protein JW743_02230 [Deltaproteobacteria bacterium]|nr:hypothetical protein [Deltaproteobacteria bacterium]MBN2844651.1 hypothetical protein [Deltaproteobacteria bacterium]